LSSSEDKIKVRKIVSCSVITLTKSNAIETRISRHYLILFNKSNEFVGIYEIDHKQFLTICVKDVGLEKTNICMLINANDWPDFYFSHVAETALKPPVNRG
jgi:hypothetical protein